MGTPHEQLLRLRRYNASVREKDSKLAEETRDRGLMPEALETLRRKRPCGRLASKALSCAASDRF
jgi:hypothetical protein